LSLDNVIALLKNEAMPPDLKRKVSACENLQD